jgi:hypothetical protein
VESCFKAMSLFFGVIFLDAKIPSGLSSAMRLVDDRLLVTRQSVRLKPRAVDMPPTSALLACDGC